MEKPAFKIDSDQKKVLLDKISEIISRFKIRSILDIGAGHKALAVPLSHKVKKYTAIEAEPSRVRQLREAGLTVIEGTFPQVEVSETYDLVLSSHSIPEQVEKYQPFLTKAWQLVKPKGWLTIITFKGVKDDLENLTSLFRKNWTDDDKPKSEEMMRILLTFGEIITEKNISHSSSENIDEIVSSLTFSISGTDDEKESYRQNLKNIIEERYKFNGRYIFPHEHLVLLVRKD